MNLVKLEDGLSESWQDSTLVERQIKVELYDEQVKDVSLEEKETSVLSPKSTASTEASVSSSIAKNKFQPQLVVLIGGLPVKAEENINADQLTEFSSDSDGYLTEDFQLKTYIKLEPKSSEGEAGKLFSKLSEETINEGFVETKCLTQEEFDIKSEEEENDQSNIKPTEVEGENWHLTSNKTGCPTDLNQTDINSHRPCLDESSVYKCFKCSYQTHRKRNLSRHVRNHNEMTFTCLHCSYKTWNSRQLKSHQLVHVPETEVKLHKCPKCLFASKWKNSLTTHLLAHKNLNVITWYHCPECPYKTKRKQYLIHNHMLKHNGKDVLINKCIYSYELPIK